MSLADEFGWGEDEELPPTNFYVFGSSVTSEHVFISKDPKLPLYHDNRYVGKRIDSGLDLPFV